MKSLTFVGILAVGIAADTATAQTGVTPPRGFSVGLAGGAAAFSDFQRTPFTVFRPAPDGGVEQHRLAQRLGAKTSSAWAASLSYWPSRKWGLRLHAALAPSRFETFLHSADEHLAEQNGLPMDTATLAPLAISFYDVQALIRLPTIKNRVMLYGIVGGGVMRYAVGGDDDDMPPEARGDFQDGARISPAGVAGLGALLPFNNRAFRLHFELTNHISRTPVQGSEAPPGESRISTMNSPRFMVGVSWAASKGGVGATGRKAVGAN